MEVILPIPTLLVIPGATVSLDSFFVLSGFLITALLLREQARYGKIGIGPFYRRRALRLLPALYVVVLANALFAYFSHQWLHTEVPSIFSVLFYYSNYYSASSSGPLNPALASGFQHLWSLSFEEQFYFIWPWLTIVLLTVRVRLRTVVIILLSLITLIGVWRFWQFQETHRWWSLFLRTDTRADSILWGALFAHIWVRGRAPKKGLVVAGMDRCCVSVGLPALCERGGSIRLLRWIRCHRCRLCRPHPRNSRWKVGGTSFVRTQALRRTRHRLVWLLPLASARVLRRTVLRPALE